MNIPDIRYLIKYTLEGIDMYSEDAEALVLGTGAVESRYRYLKQVRGPARSFWQVEPSTAEDNLESWLKFRPDVWKKVAKTCILPVRYDVKTALTVNMAFAICMCRIKYRRNKNPIPDKDDYLGLAKYHKLVYNTNLGKSNIEESEEIFREFLRRNN